METIDKIVMGMVVCGVLVACKLCWNEYSYNRIPVKRVECCLLNYSRDEGEACRTVWACEEYGKLESQDRKLHERARERMVLHIRSKGDDTRIVGFDDV